MKLDHKRGGGGGGDGKLSREALKLSDFFFRPERPYDYLVLLTRLCLLTCLIASVSLVLHTAFISSSSGYSAYRFSLPASTFKSEALPLPGSIGPTNLSHIQFCIAGAAETWHDRSRYTSLWWGNLTRGFVWLDEPAKIERNETDDRFLIPVRVSDPSWGRFRYSSSKAAVRIARIIWDSFRLNLPDVRWFVMGDDDTVFFTENLVSVLAKYNHSQMWYIGANSESVEQDTMHSYDMAFGGGGVAVSYPLARRLAGAMDGCLERYFYFYGSDQRIAACIAEIGVPFSAERGFHQLDIRGDPYGLLASHPLVPLVSLHHLDYLEPVFPHQTRIESLETLMRSYAADPPRVLQQTFCQDHRRKWTISISWGYTLQIYTYFQSAKELEMPLQTFKTWRSWSHGPFTFNTRPVSSDPCQRPVVYFLTDVEKVRTSGTRSRYKRSDGESGSCGKKDYATAMAVDMVTVSSMKMDPEYWNQAPRRQCCEVMNGGSFKKGEMVIRVRKCRTSETISK